MKHTPGVWLKQENKFGGLFVGTEEGHPIAALARKPTLQEETANARLIAAAPELLEMLQWALECVRVGIDELGINPKNSEAYQQALVLIAELEGEDREGYGEPCEGRR